MGKLKPWGGVRLIVRWQGGVSPQITPICPSPGKESPQAFAFLKYKTQNIASLQRCICLFFTVNLQHNGRV